MRHQQLLILLVVCCRPAAPSCARSRADQPIPSELRTPFSAHEFRTLDSPEPMGNGVLHITGASQHPRKRQESRIHPHLALPNDGAWDRGNAWT